MTAPVTFQREKIPWPVIVGMLVRLAAGLLVLIGAYALIPLGGDGWWSAALPSMIIGLSLFSFVFVRGLRGIVRAEHPAVRAVEAMVMTIGIILIIFATIAVEVEAQWPGSYSEPLTKLDAVYFSVTTLATVGYGDITPVSQYARGIGIAQMLANLAVLGLAVRMLTRAVTRSQQLRSAAATDE